MIQNQLRNTTALWKPAHQLVSVHSELVTLWSQLLCSVISGEEVPSSSNDAGGFGDPFSQLQLLFGASGEDDLALFPNSPPFCGWPSSPLCMRM